MKQDVAVAILSAIEPPLPECLAAVEAQLGGPYRVIHVKDVFPMSAAFNAMILATDARYVVQVDGDVVLKPWAVQRLYEAIRQTWWCYAAWGGLWEDGFGEGGSVRIWRRWPVRLLGFRDVRCVDRNLHHRMRFLGMRRLEVLGRTDQSITEASEAFGTHFPRQTLFARYSKMYNDIQKWIVLGRWDLVCSAGKPLRMGDIAREGFMDALHNMESRRRSKNIEEDWWQYLSHIPEVQG